MSEQTISQNQRFHLILADIAMAAAIGSLGGSLTDADRAGYVPGALRDRWLARTPDGPQRRRVTAMANAGVGALTAMPADRLVATAARFGLAIERQDAERMAEHFDAKREALLQYKR